jgi:hypothetical protein
VATLRTILAVVLIGSGLGLLAKSGVQIPPVVLGAFPAVVLMLLGVALRGRKRGAEGADAVGPTPPPLPSRG